MARQAPPCPNSVTLYKVGEHQTIDYTITLEGPTNNGLTWTYKAKKNSGNNLSHFDVEICFNDFVDPAAVITSWKILQLENGTCIQNPPLAEGTGPDDNFEVLPSGDPSTDCMSATPLIKFNSLSDFASVTDFCFEFTLAKCYSTGCTLIGGKAGTVDACASIQGPSPDCDPCLTRGLKI